MCRAHLQNINKVDAGNLPGAATLPPRSAVSKSLLMLLMICYNAKRRTNMLGKRVIERNPLTTFLSELKKVILLY